MKILKIQVLRGPNIWSNYRSKLIQMRLDLEDMEQRPTNKINGFRERIETLIPSLYDHRCSEDSKGGFFYRVERGTWMGHVIEHIALELQSLAGMETGYGRTRETYTPGVYNVVFSYIEENVGVYAAEAAVRIAESLISGEEYDLQADIQRMREIRQRDRLGPSTSSIINEAVARGIPWMRLGSNSLVQLGFGINQMRFQATLTKKTSQIAVQLASNKSETKKMLKSASVPIAESDVCTNFSNMERIISDIGFPIVVKPLTGHRGKGVSININSKEAAKEALAHAKKYSRHVIVEKYITGSNFRVLIIDNKFVAAAQRIPANVTGNGSDNLQQLIDRENLNPNRGLGHENVLTEIVIDNDTLETLKHRGYTLESIPTNGEVVYLKSTAKLSTGGSSIDVTEMVHPENIFLCERIAMVIGLDVCGIDIIAENLTDPLTSSGGVVLSVNAAPGFRMHLAPTEGLPRNVASPVIDLLYPPGKQSRIPIFAITGTNGKTTTTRLLAHIVKYNGHKVGFTTSDGIYIQNHMMEKGDTTGPYSAQYVLRDPTVEFAVLETARGGILRSGLAFNKCDIGIITNIKEDHLGQSDIHTIEDLTNLKAVVARSIKKDGWAVLNADDPQCVKIAKELDCNIAYFSMDENNPILCRVGEQECIAAVYENGFITIKKGAWKIRISKATHVPLTVGGKAGFMIANVLAATLASYLWGFKTEDITLALHTFMPGTAQTPGRMNIFEFSKFKVLVDFAHNPAGYNAVADFLSNIEEPEKIGIISAVGDRRDEDIIECARIAATMFTHIIIKDEKDPRGRSYEEIQDLLIRGIKSANTGTTYEIISDQEKAIDTALSRAHEGTFITAFSKAIHYVQQKLDEEHERIITSVKPQ